MTFRVAFHLWDGGIRSSVPFSSSLNPAHPASVIPDFHLCFLAEHVGRAARGGTAHSGLHGGPWRSHEECAAHAGALPSPGGGPQAPHEDPQDAVSGRSLSDAQLGSLAGDLPWVLLGRRNSPRPPLCKHLSLLALMTLPGWVMRRLQEKKTQLRGPPPTHTHPPFFASLAGKAGAS